MHPKAPQKDFAKARMTSDRNKNEMPVAAFRINLSEAQIDQMFVPLQKLEEEVFFQVHVFKVQFPELGDLGIA